MSKNEAFCVLTRQDIRIWITDEEAKKLVGTIAKTGKGMVIVAGRMINTADIVGVLTGEDILEKTQRGRGLWQTKTGEWNTRKEGLARDPYIPSLSEVVEDRKKALQAQEKKQIEGGNDL